MYSIKDYIADLL